ncbi:MAG: tyrosine-type recombinase/integrase [Alphaproteobacteria bacterium]|nr:tyrosine-type recombinase/integrase [Alphaproteobacteria bacterium]
MAVDNLYQRGGVYWCRFYVPASEQKRLGKKEVAWSLKTRDPKEAKRRLAEAQVRFNGLAIPPDPIRQKLTERFGIPEGWTSTQVAAALDKLTAAAIHADERYADKVKGLFHLWEDGGISIDLSLAHAKLKGDHRPFDAEFNSAATDLGLDPKAVANIPAIAGEAQQSSTAKNTLSKIAKSWEEERKPAAKTVVEVKSTIQQFESHIGRKPVEAIVKRDIVAFKDLLVRTVGRNGKPLSPGSIQKRVNLIKTLLEYAATNDIIPANPARGLSIPKGQSERLAFSLSDLDKLFDPANLPRSKTYRLLMLMALYTGARLGELAQLKGQDIRQEEGVWCLSIDDQDQEQRIKTSSSRRLVPLHPVLIEAGLPDLSSRKEARLFSDLTYDQFQGYGKQASKDINRLIRRLIGDQRKVFHSFRHTFKDLCRNAGIPEDVHDRLTGHASGHVGRSYGSGHGVQRLNEEIRKIEGRWRQP